jgi:hypothetical protein
MDEIITNEFHGNFVKKDGICYFFATETTEFANVSDDGFESFDSCEDCLDENSSSSSDFVSFTFTFNVKTDNSGESASNQFKIGTISTGVYDFTVEWGDGSSDVITTWDDPALTYTYSVAGTYTIMISGNTFEYPRNAFPFGGDAPKILDVSNFGLLSYGNSAELTFYGATNMTFSASDIFNTSVTTNFQNAWNGCSSLTSFPLIDTSSGTNFQSAWEFCSSLTSFPLIDTSSVTNFRNAWQNCSSLTAFLLIDTSSGTNFLRTWQNCSSLTSFPLIDTSLGTTFQDAWRGCSSLTSFPLIDTSLGTDFQLAWSNCALNSASIDNIMQSLVNNGQFNKITSVGGGTSLPFASWSAGAQANFNILISRGWTIIIN